MKFDALKTNFVTESNEKVVGEGDYGSRHTHMTHGWVWCGQPWVWPGQPSPSTTGWLGLQRLDPMVVGSLAIRSGNLWVRFMLSSVLILFC